MQDFNSISPTSAAQTNYEKYKEYFSKDSDTTVSIDVFLQLLVAQMNNQDPMEPTSNTEFVSQLAQFTSLQSMQNLTYFSNASFASSMIGKTVTVATTGAAGKVDVETGVITGIQMSGDSFTYTVNGKTVEMKNIMAIGEVPKTEETEETGAEETAGTEEISSEQQMVSDLFESMLAQQENSNYV